MHTEDLGPEASLEPASGCRGLDPLYFLGAEGPGRLRHRSPPSLSAYAHQFVSQTCRQLPAEIASSVRGYQHEARPGVPCREEGDRRGRYWRGPPEAGARALLHTRHPARGSQGRLSSGTGHAHSVPFWSATLLMPLLDSAGRRAACSRRFYVKREMQVGRPRRPRLPWRPVCVGGPEWATLSRCHPPGSSALAQSRAPCHPGWGDSQRELAQVWR